MGFQMRPIQKEVSRRDSGRDISKKRPVLAIRAAFAAHATLREIALLHSASRRHRAFRRASLRPLRSPIDRCWELQYDSFQFYCRPFRSGSQKELFLHVLHLYTAIKELSSKSPRYFFDTRKTVFVPYFQRPAGIPGGKSKKNRDKRAIRNPTSSS